MVRLLPIKRFQSIVSQVRFQSHNGAIATGETGLHGYRPPYVSIPQWCDCYHCFFTARRSSCSSFNPTMVRLLQTSPSIRCRSWALFQSHNGAIATPIPVSECRYRIMFQSHNGAIATWRLRSWVDEVFEFQSHNGAIATVFMIQT